MAKNEYLEEMRRRYRKARSRSEKSQLLDEICATCGYHRKHALRAVRRRSGSREATAGTKRGPKVSYEGKELIRPLKIVWLTANLPCSKRLKAILPVWLRGYESEFGELSDEVRRKLLSVSPSTIDRLLKRARLEHSGRGRTTTKPGTLLRNTVPIKTGQWDESRPGFIEADTVAHCGTSMAGQFAWTVDCVDIATGWTEQRAVWAKREEDVVEQMQSIEKALPFPLLGFDSDNGGEFLNHRLLKHFLGRRKPVQFTRSRAYKKNDNAHVEQKNWTHVRQWLGYDRLDKPEVIALMNELYENEWRLFHNFYCPSVKLLSKQRVGSKTIKKHDEPKTPYQRVQESEHISDYAKRGLQHIFEHTNPFHLRRRMEEKLKKVFAVIQCQTNPMPEALR
jgi:hypothetical protein